MAYTTVDNPELYFQAKAYTGNGTAIGSGGLAVTLDGDEDMQPDFVWLKNRSTADRSNQVYDVVRGVTKGLKTNSSDEENTSSERLTAFGSDGFTVGDNVDVNTSGDNYVAWCWKAGTSFTNDASATSVGTLDSSGSSSQTAGFSIVSYTSNGSSSQSVAHNLGAVPHMIISKNRDNSSTNYNDWIVYHHKNATANDKKLKLNTTDAVSTTNEWGDTDPTSTVYSLHTSGDGTTNVSSDKIVSYVFTSKQGYSKFGSYTGNANADGVFCFTGFLPAFVIMKNTADSGASWQLFDNKRNTYNQMSGRLFPDSTAAESTDGDNNIDFLSNGFKMRTSNGDTNAASAFIYMAFAEAPFVNSNGVPCNAR